MNDKTKKKLSTKIESQPKLGPKAEARAKKRDILYQRALERRKQSLRLQEYVSIGETELLDIYNSAIRAKVQGKIVLIPRKAIMSDCPFDLELAGELVVMRTVAEILQLNHTELEGESS